MAEKIIAFVLALTVWFSAPRGSRSFAPTFAGTRCSGETRASTVALCATDRRSFFADCARTSAGAAFLPWLGTSSIAVAEDLDDLSMPSDDEKAKQEAEMAERIRKKAELQKKASKPLSFKESMKQEMAKKTEMKKSKAEMAAAMCEELGRGC